jgi:uncharacterized OsmC-like protein
MSLKALIDDNRSAIEADPVKASATFAVTGHLAGTTEVAIRARRHGLTVDEPPALAGADRGANPVEHALIALASCQAITYLFWAAQLGIELESVDVIAEGDLDVRGFFGFDQGVRPGFTAVRLEVTPSGPESAGRYEQLADAVDAHCPVYDIFSNATPIERTVAVTAS